MGVFVTFGCKILGFKNTAGVKEMTNMRYVHHYHETGLSKYLYVALDVLAESKQWESWECWLRNVALGCLIIDHQTEISNLTKFDHEHQQSIIGIIRLASGCLPYMSSSSRKTDDDDDDIVMIRIFVRGGHL